MESKNMDFALSTSNFKDGRWVKWDQINFGFFNRKGTAASSLRKGVPYSLRIIIPQTDLLLTKVRYCTSLLQFDGSETTLNIFTKMRIHQVLNGKSLTAEIQDSELQSVVQWDESQGNIERTTIGLSVGLSFNFLKNRKEICDLETCAQNIPTKFNAKRVYSFIITLGIGSIKREYQVDIPWKGTAVTAKDNKRTKSIADSEEPSSVDDLAPPIKKVKTGIVSAPIINSIIPLMCDIGLAEIQQQITSVGGKNLPNVVQLLFGSVPATGHQIPCVYYVPKLSNIPRQYIHHEREAKGPLVIEKYYVPLEAKSDEQLSICFQYNEQPITTMLYFIYQGTTDAFLANLLEKNSQTVEEPESPNGFDFDFSVNSPDSEPLSPLGLFPSDGFQQSLSLSEPVMIHMISRCKKTIAQMKNKCDILGRTILHHTCFKGYANAVKLLIDLGFDKNKEDIFGRNALYYALMSGNKILIDLFVENKEIRNDVDIDTLVNQLSMLKTKFNEESKSYQSKSERTKIENEMKEIQIKIDMDEKETQSRAIQAEEEKGITTSQTMRDKISARKREMAVKKIHNETEIKEERASEDSSFAMREKIEARKKELAEKKRSEDMEESRKYAEEEKFAYEEARALKDNKQQETITELELDDEGLIAIRDKIEAKKRFLAERKKQELEVYNDKKSEEYSPSIRDRIAMRKRDKKMEDDMMKSKLEEEKVEEARMMREMIELRKKEIADKKREEEEKKRLEDEEKLTFESSARERIEARKKELAEKKRLEDEEKLTFESSARERIEARKKELARISPEEEEEKAIRDKIENRKKKLGEKKDQPSEESDEFKKYFTLAELQKRPPGLDIGSLEKYLTDEEFLKIFSMTKNDFYKLARQKQVELKKTVSLY